MKNSKQLQSDEICFVEKIYRSIFIQRAVMILVERLSLTLFTELNSHRKRLKRHDKR